MPVVRGESGALMLGGVSLATLEGDPRVGTPSYVYDVDAMKREVEHLDAAFDGAPHLIAYAVKANSAGTVVRALREAGCGADVVSGGELALARACGVAPGDILFSGVAKADREIDAAIHAGPEGIGAVQLESVEEIARVAARARAASRSVRVSLRINPEASLDALGTHAHIATGHDEAKFGIPLASVPDALAELQRAPELLLAGLSSHAGSQFVTTAPYLKAARTLFDVVASVRHRHAATLRFVDTGGGFGVDYGAGCSAAPADFVRETRALQREAGLDDLSLHIEPGRALVAAHGVLLASVVQTKVSGRRRWLMIDAGMNDLVRPALYQARHRVVAVDVEADGAGDVAFRVVGPVCESSDDFGEHELPAAPSRLVAILDAGAYGFTMASRYNGRALPAEVFLRGGVASVRSRQDEDAWVKDRLES